jgi:hypothetical protein
MVRMLLAQTLPKTRFATMEEILMSTSVPAPAKPEERRPGTPQRLAYLYRTHLIHTDREDDFLIWSSFSLTFLVVRFITHSIRDKRFTRVFRNVGGGGGRHIHHLVFGISGLLVVGYIATGRHPMRAALRRVESILYGMAAALTLDEFALWLDLQDVYWAKQGRMSVDAAILTSTVMGMGVTGRGLLKGMAHDTSVLWRRALRKSTGEGGQLTAPMSPQRAQAR